MNPKKLTKAQVRVIVAIDALVEYYKQVKGVTPDAIALTRDQAATLQIKDGDQYQGMTVQIA